jgi:peroxiredoxin
MHRRMGTILVATILAAAAARPEPGQKAPPFSLESSTGKKVSLQDLRGRPVVLAFFPKAFTSG